MDSLSSSILSFSPMIVSLPAMAYMFSLLIFSRELMISDFVFMMDLYSCVFSSIFFFIFSSFSSYSLYICSICTFLCLVSSVHCVSLLAYIVLERSDELSSS
uniref:Uncharacterized protein n=1 Tax=Cacopsylla melanoneura TaxID=428564 RepID=A0A8D8Z8X8_9HEMI